MELPGERVIRIQMVGMSIISWQLLTKCMKLN